MSFLETVRKVRVGPDIAAFDLVGSVTVAYFLARRNGWGVIPTVVGTLILGHLTHVVLNVETTLHVINDE